LKGLEEQIKAISAKRNEKQHIEIHLNGLKARLKQLESELTHCHIELDELENFLQEEELSTIAKLFNKILGSQQQNQERDRQNYLQTYLRCEGCEILIAEKEFEISVLENKLTSYVGVEDMYDKLLNEKKQQLKYRHKDLVNDIVLLETAMRHQSYLLKEIDEAMVIGLELEKTLIFLYDALVDICTIDFFESNEIRKGKTGYNVSFQKINEAKNLQQSVQIISRLCDKFVDALHDISERFDLDYKPFTPRISRFLEQFYDGFISDWIRHSELKICLNHIDTTLAKVRRIIGMLRKDHKQAVSLLEDHTQKLEMLVLGKDIY